MEANDLQRLYLDLTTPHVADAIMRLGLPVRLAPATSHPCGRERTSSDGLSLHSTQAASTCSSKRSRSHDPATS